MNVYRLDPIDAAHPSWKASTELDSVWACAATPGDARELTARKTLRENVGPAEFDSPWRIPTVTSCLHQPSMKLMDPGTVVRADGSLVGD